MEYGSNFRVVFRGGEVKMSWQKVNYWNWSTITYFMVMTVFSCRLQGICPIAGHLWCMKWNRMEFCHTEPLKRCLLHELWHSIMRIGQPAKESSTIKRICLSGSNPCLSQLHGSTTASLPFGHSHQMNRKLDVFAENGPLSGSRILCLMKRQRDNWMNDASCKRTHF